MHRTRLHQDGEKLFIKMLRVSKTFYFQNDNLSQILFIDVHGRKRAWNKV